MTEKTCPLCKESKPLNAKYFHKDKRNTTGFHRACKPCRRKTELERWKGKAETENAKRRANYVPTGYSTSGNLKGERGSLPKKKAVVRRRCKDCDRLKTLNERYWQKEARKSTGFRQPCKKCLAKRKQLSFSLDVKKES